MTDSRRHEIDQIVKRHRDKLLARHGKGSLRAAEVSILAEKGHSLERELELYREQVLISGHMIQKVGYKIHVIRRDVERYFAEHPEEFGQTGAMVRVIVITDEATAALVDRELIAGKSFVEVGKSHSVLDKETGGLLVEYKKDFETFDATGWPPVNEAVRKLKAGEHTPQIEVKAGLWAWAKLEKLGGGKTRHCGRSI